MPETRTALVTGSAGFVGHALALRLLREGWRVSGRDAVTDDYDPALKRARLAATGRAIEKRMLPMQPGDAPATWADTGLLERLTGRRPATPVAEGVRRFVDWYRGWTGA